jgi:hypothetical protein
VCDAALDGARAIDPRDDMKRNDLVACGAALVLAALAGCEPAPTPVPAATDAPPAAAPPAAATAPPPPAPAPAPQAATAVLQALTLGDRACYVTLADAQAQSREEMGRMELCELTALIGQPVMPAYGEERVAAESCQGDPECTETETVRLITELQPLH